MHLYNPTLLNLFLSVFSHLFFRTLGLVFQSENFNFNRYTNHIMDSWSYMDSPVPEQNHSKPRLQPGDDLAALTMLYEQCKVNKAPSVIKKKKKDYVQQCINIYVYIFEPIYFRTRKTRSLLHVTVWAVSAKQKSKIFHHSNGKPVQDFYVFEKSQISKNNKITMQ